MPGAAAWASAIGAVALVLATSGARPPHSMVKQIAATPSPPYDWLARNARDGALLELPSGSVTSIANRMVLSTFHWRPLIDGYSAYPPLTRRYLFRMADELPSQQALQELVDQVDLRWLLVHLAPFSPAERDAWLASPPGLALVERWDDVLLFEVTLPIARDRRELLRRTDRTLDGLEQRPLGARCPGRIEVVATDEVAAGKPVKLQLRIVNDGDEPFPGAGLYPRHLVELRRMLRRDGRPTGLPVTVPVWTDVPAGQSVEAQVELPALPEAGAWQLDLELVQDGDSLARCGMEPTSTQITATPRDAQAAAAKSNDDAAASPTP
jgi:hypothetical protein